MDTMEPHDSPRRQLRARYAERVDPAPSLAPWHMLSSRVARLIKHQPSLAARLLCAPRDAFHAAAVYLLHNVHKSDADVGGEMVELSPKAMIDRCFEAAPGYLSALKKCGATVEPIAFYVSLNECLKTSLAKEVLSAKEVSSKLIIFLQNISNLDPLIPHAENALQLDIHRAVKFDALIKLCRKLGIMDDDEIESVILRGMPRSKLSDYFARKFRRCKSPLSVQLTHPFQLVESARHLGEVARGFKNCLKRPTYNLRLGTGSHMYVLVYEPHESVFELKHEQENKWSIIECERRDRGNVTYAMREVLCAELRQYGLDAQPYSADELLNDILGPEIFPWYQENYSDSEDN